MRSLFLSWLYLLAPARVSCRLVGAVIFRRFFSLRLGSAEVEAAEVHDRLLKFDFDTVNFLGVVIDDESPGQRYLASFGDVLDHTFAQSVGGSRQVQPIKTVSETYLLLRIHFTL